MINTVLKAQIDSQITNETLPNSISPADVGGNLKAVVDYIDQESQTPTLQETVNANNTITDQIIRISSDSYLTELYAGELSLSEPSGSALSMGHGFISHNNVAVAGGNTLNYIKNTGGNNQYYFPNNPNGNHTLATIDYITSKILKVTLSSSEILNLRTTPKILLPAQLGKLFVVDFIYYKYNHVSTGYVSGGNLSICYGNVSEFAYNFTNIIDSTENTYAFSTANYSVIKQSSYVNTNVILSTTTSNPTGGNGNLELYISYKEITI